MSARLERRQQTGNLHLITFSCHGRNPYLASPKAASIFEHSLEAIRLKYSFQIYGYVVMPDHIHLIVSEPPTHPLSTVLGSLKRSVSKQLPESPFWLPRYHDFNIVTTTAHREAPLPPPQPSGLRPGSQPRRLSLVQLPHLCHPQPRRRPHHDGCPMITERKRGYRGVTLYVPGRLPKPKPSVEGSNPTITATR